MTLSLVFIVAGLVVIALVAAREHAKVTSARRTLLDRCAPLLANAKIKHGGDGFPTLEGRHRGKFLRAELVPDTMTIRRLPQLWLKLTLIEVRPGIAEYSFLVRPSGTEFYSLTSTHAVVLEPPADISADAVAKGSHHASQLTLSSSALVLRRAFSDSRMKEVAVTHKGLRLIWQADEGTRGEHLLFRQCRFEDVDITPSNFANLLAIFDELSSSLDAKDEAEAA
jgi:hypothetical protein